MVDDVGAGAFGEDGVLDGQRDLAEVVATGRTAEIEVLADHVTHDPLEIDLGARRLGGHGTVAQHHRVVGDLQRLLQVVRDVDDRHPSRREVADHLEQRLHLRRRERRRGLVHDQDAAVDRQGTRDLDDLLLPEAQVFDQGQRIDRFLELCHQRPRAPRLFGKVDAGGAAQLAAHEDVVAHREVRCQAQLLVNDRDAAFACVRGRRQDHRHAVEHDVARRGRDHAREDLHQRGLAGAVFTEQRRDLSAVDVEVHALERLHAAVRLGDVPRRQHDRAVGMTGDASGAHCTPSRTGVTSQLDGLMSWNTPTTSTFLPVSASRSSVPSTCALTSLFSAEPASW
ncbi:hypothetical protein D3C85_766180 [compost metagenome]